MPNDICVLKMKSAISMNDYVQTIDLADIGDFAGQNCVISGWGLTGQYKYMCVTLYHIESGQREIINDYY